MNNRHQKLTQESQAKYDEPSLIVIRYSCIKRSRTREFMENALLSVGIVCLLSTAFLGIGALGCWGFEIIGANSSSSIINHYNWQARKNVCLGGMLVCISGVLGSALLNGCINFDE
ncbi:hypothetical protein [Nostoc sp. PCC 7107]|uniref:hypothetical protein n=1 Tax=Nostoc sp. PCC 7107 TaxID=317936 RepID=UPI00029F3A7D|nr:hypothetical protein [Nostoc sp. PCC 7107]AFY45754.1 hypothetical protein Nos7107_5256 [Nostoc sp. PCC 7107]